MSDERTLTVLTLNLWNRAAPWEERLAVIRRGVEALAPDVIALQEAIRFPEYGFDQPALVAEAMGYHIAHGQPDDGPYPFGNSVLSRWPIAHHEVLLLPRGGTDENRCAVLARLETPWGALPFATTHLNWKMHHGHVRVAQVQALVAALTGFTREGDLPAVLAGDFNAEPESDEIRYLRGHTGLGGECVYFNDCFAAAGDGSRGATFARRNPYAAVSREPDRRLDYVFVRGPDERARGAPLASGLCFDEPVHGVWASDHFGVWARIEV